MDEKPILISEISLEQFRKFKEKYLDKNSLDENTLKEIERLFNMDKKEATGSREDVFRINCDDYHAHTYSCLEFYNPEAGIVERLVGEIRRYQNILKEIHNKRL